MRLSANLRVLYLHGFASSPASRKAQFFSAQLERLGFQVEIPDLAEADFEHLAISKQLAVVARVARSEPVILIGSSMGGYLAALYAARHPEVERVILMAPAFDFYQLWSRELGEEKLHVWKEQGTLPVFHHGEGRTMPLAFEMFEDARQFPAYPDFSQPGLIFHGTADSVVPLQKSIEFAATHANVRLIKFPTGHELTDVLDDMWNASNDFLLSGRHPL
ncbi:MAG TPA: YqiA/YcfP family alpha/beta fold hydrolase [Bryobacteraceae bacterium]|nr:YqiA/YcfP family alpha/beta fold hydrolase [Bryobacteraceae bacterium]